MTNQQGAPEALRHADGLESFAQMLPAYGFDPQPLKDAAATVRSLHALALELADQLSGKNERLAALVEAQQPAPSAAAARSLSDGQRALHEAILNRLSHAELLEKAHYLMELNSNQARTIGELQDLVEAAPQPSPTPQADSQPAPVLTSETGGDWTQPTTVALRLGDAMQLLCGGKRPPDDMVQQWLDNTSESLQEFAASNGPAWAQGIGLIDAAMVMVDQPTEIRTIDNPDRDHKHRAARAQADSVTAPPGGMVQAPIYRIRTKNTKNVVWTTVPKHEYLAALEAPEIFECELIATPPAQAADSVLEDAALPMQPICVASNGVVRFKENRMVNDIYEFSQPRGFGLNEMARRDYTQEERMQFAQLIGYSVSGYGGLSYASPESVAKADTMAEALLAARKQGGAT